jgi:hypothetical protein
LYRILFRLLTPPGQGSASAVLSSSPVTIAGPPERGETAALVRPAPYVVSGFGEAFLLAPESFPLDVGDRLTVLRDARPLAHAMIAETIARDGAASPIPTPSTLES